MTSETQTLTPFDTDLRAEIYQHFARTTQAPAVEALAKQMSVAATKIEQSLTRLAALHAIALKPDSLDIWMAHPFSSVVTDYPVETSRGRYWANCAWDAFGIPVVLGLRETKTPTRCAGSGEPVELGLRDGRPRLTEGLIHFVVCPHDFWNDIGFT
jgi:hypothetical protein